MNILLIGATGMIGADLAAEARRRGHQVTGVSRSGGEGFTAASATDTAHIATLADGHDAVVMAISAPDSSRDSPGPLVVAGKSLIEATRSAGVRRLMVVGGAGGLLLPDGGRVVDADWFPVEVKGVALAHVELLELLRREARDLDWTYVSPPPIIEPGERTATYTAGLDHVVADSEGVSTISVADYAVAFLDELEQGGNIKRQMTAAYT